MIEILAICIFCFSIYALNRNSQKYLESVAESDDLVKLIVCSILIISVWIMLCVVLVYLLFFKD